MSPVAVLIPVPDVSAALDWYRLALPDARLLRFDGDAPAILDLNGFSIELVPSDEKVSHGKCGTVLYWSVANIDAVIKRLQSMGATLYRGPLPIENNLSMCQLEDPFGNLIGFRGPAGHFE